MKKSVKKVDLSSEPRNFGITVLGGTMAVFSGIFALGLTPTNPHDLSSLPYFVVAVMFFLAFLATAIVGRKGLLKAVFGSIFYFG